VVDADLYSRLAGRRLRGGVPGDLRGRLAAYLESRDITHLDAVMRGWPGHLEVVVDINSHQSFLVLGEDEGSLSLALNLGPRLPEAVERLAEGFSRAEVNRFVERRAGWLEAGP
jgi:hypothetical protein